MRIFLYEYASCQSGTLPESLRREGRAMLSALVADANRLAGVTVSLLPETLARDDEEAAFRRLSSSADLTFVVAPESSGLLRARHDWTVACGGHWLGSAPNAIDLTTDKLALAAHFREHGVPTPAVIEANTAPALLPDDFYPAVLKPRDGAGALATILVRRREDLPACRRLVEEEDGAEELILQRFAPGRAASVCFVIGPDDMVAMRPGEQRLSADGRFHYLGGSFPLPPALSERALARATRAVQSVSGLLGWIGVDLVLGECVDGSADQVIEINPRLTTSYLGLRQATDANLLGLLLDVWSGNATTIEWRRARVRFQLDADR